MKTLQEKLEFLDSIGGFRITLWKDFDVIGDGLHLNEFDLDFLSEMNIEGRESDSIVIEFDFDNDLDTSVVSNLCSLTDEPITSKKEFIKIIDMLVTGDIGYSSYIEREALEYVAISLCKIENMRLINDEYTDIIEPELDGPTE